MQEAGGSQYFTYEGVAGASTKTITITIKKVKSISFTNDGTDDLVIKFNRENTLGTYGRTVKPNETFIVDGAFDQVVVISPYTGETNNFRLFVLGE